MRFLLVLSLLLSACSIPIKETQKPKTDNLVNIYLERTGPTSWFLVYRAHNPVKKLEFERHYNRFRHTIFKVISEGFRVYEEDKREFIEKYDGTAFNEVSI